uniref:Ribonuclease P protein component n=1 Tax=uncultured bacterium fosmid pJB135F11 TaxID=1478051 RepID=A0A0H3UAV9_9BACT|nr:hypothetical protein [uncultured bacterium fosmid pJB135F11]
MRNTFDKSERLCSKKAIDDLFQGGQRSYAAYPVRVVFRHSDTPENRILVSVSKRHFKRAVKRNRVKRQIREAYRLNRNLLSSSGLDIAFLWLSDDLYPSDIVTEKVKNLLSRIQENA